MSLQPYLHAMGIQTWALKNKTQVTYLLVSDETDAMTDASEHLLSAMLASIELSRDEVLTSPALIKQAANLQPRLILVLGAKAAHQLFNCETPMDELRGKVHAFGNIPCLVTHHPAHLLRHPKHKRETYQDLRMAFNML